MQIIVFKNSLAWGWKDNKCGFGFHHFFLKSKSCQWFFFGAGQEKGFFSSKHHAPDPMLFWGLHYTDSRKKIRFIDSQIPVQLHSVGSLNSVKVREHLQGRNWQTLKSALPPRVHG